MVYQSLHFVVSLPRKLRAYVLACVAEAEQKYQEYCQLFQTDGAAVRQVKVAYFTKRAAMVKHIKQITGGAVPPPWAAACFYGGALQIHVDPQDAIALNKQRAALAHELFHLFFNHYIYGAAHLARVRWLDESLASAVARSATVVDAVDYLALATKLSAIKNLDVNILDDWTQVNPPDGRYRGYEIFNLLGEYCRRQNLVPTLLSLVKHDYAALREKGRTILVDCLDYFLA